jgi:hypothetical protein
MRQKEVYGESGKSKKGFSGATVAGSILSNKKSSKTIADSLLNNNQRTYYRKRKVWLCDGCYNKVSSRKPGDTSWIKWALFLGFCFWAWIESQ